MVAWLGGPNTCPGMYVLQCRWAENVTRNVVTIVTKKYISTWFLAALPDVTTIVVTIVTKK